MVKGLACLCARWARCNAADIPPGSAALIVSLAALPMLVGAWHFGLREDTGAAPQQERPAAEMVRAEQALHAGYKVFPNSNSRLFEADDAPLATGSPLPTLTAPGWLNGVPDADELDGKVLVVDVWDGTCPYCSLAAPALIEANAKYHDRGVVFIGLTTASEDESQQYVDHWHLPWPNGYDATTTVDALQAHAPTLFVIGPRGRVLWNDDRARWRHDIGGLAQRLERAIEGALAINPAAFQDSDAL